MASKPRNYVAHQPVSITFRCALRLVFLKAPELRELFEQLVAIEAERCEVDVYALEIRDNHAHLIVSQRFHCHDRTRKKGIAAFTRNLLSRWVKKANAYHSTQGRLTERTYLSMRIESHEILLWQLAYVLCNGYHHARLDPAEVSGSWSVYADHAPDGVVTRIPALAARDLGCPLDQLVRAISERGEDLRGRGASAPWLEATRREVAERGILLPTAEVDLGGPAVADWLGAEVHERRREELVTRPWIRIEFEARRGPQLAEVIEIVVRRELEAERLFE